MKAKSLLSIAVFVLISFCAAANNPGNPVLKAGTAKVNITPEKTRYPVHDSLYLRSLILEEGDTRIAFLSFDLGGYQNAELAERLKKKYRLQEVYFCPSHTHSGERGEQKWLEGRFEEAVRLAAADMFETKVSAGWRDFPPIVFNRLIIREDGHARESWFADKHYRYINRERLIHGPVDPSVGVIKFEDKQGNIRALIMNFACHADAIWNNFEISADYVGYATKYTEEALGGDVNCLFVQGGAGNQAPLFKDGGRNGENDPRKADYDLIDRMGKLLSIEAVKLAKEIYPNPNDVADLKVKSDMLNFTGRFDKTLFYDVNFSVVQINGRIVIATCPGEPFIKFQLDWKREMETCGTPFYFGYTWNGGKWPIYIPDVRSSALGGYGADWGPDLIEVGAGERILAKQIELYYRMIELMRNEEGPKDHITDDQVPSED